MKIDIMNRMQAVDFEFDDKTAVISISGKYDDCPNIKSKKVLYLKFDDYDKFHQNSINKIDANNVIQFINDNIKGINRIVVHCGAGKSRSAGVAAAIGKWMNNDDNFVFDNSYYIPNMLCYRMVLTASQEINKGE